MATDLEKLVVQLSADLKQYQNGMQQAMGVTNRQARAIENRWRQSERNLNALGRSMAAGLVAPLAGIGAAITTREVFAYADAWTKAKNSLAVAGVTGARQVAVLDRLFASAQANGAPIGALADLYGKAAQSADNLGASTEDLITFADGVATALRVAGTSSEEAAGALLQLGQLLGSARVQAEEFNSVQEGARPILIAVANGLDKAGGSVSKLKQLVTDGAVSGRDFFQAFIKGLPTIKAMAANATQTISQGMTNVQNALTKYIGETDSSLGASQRLVQGLNALADNFDQTADAVLKVAAIIAGALVGRAILPMIVNLGLGTAALVRFLSALRGATAMTAIATTISGLGAAAGPVGLVIGGAVVGALALFANSSEKASVGARAFEAALKQVEDRAKSTAAAVNSAAPGNNQLFNALTSGAEEGKNRLAQAREEINKYLTNVTSMASSRLLSDAQRKELLDLRDGLVNGSVKAEDAKEKLYALANSNPGFQKLANQMSPLLDKLRDIIAGIKQVNEDLKTISPPSFREAENASMAAYDKMVASGKAFLADLDKQNALSKSELEIQKTIAEIKKKAAADGVSLSDKQLRQAAIDQIAAEKRRGEEGKKSQPDDYQREIEASRKRREEMGLEISTLGQSAYAVEYARKKWELLNAAKEAGRAITPQLTAEIEREAAAHATAAQRLDEAHKAQERLDAQKQKAAQLSQGVQDGLADVASSGLIAITRGESAVDAITDSLQMLEQQIIRMIMNHLFEQLFGAMPGGGLNIGGLIFGATGGGARTATAAPANVSAYTGAAGGGATTAVGAMKGLDELFASRLKAFIDAAKASGFDISVNSGFRSVERQAQLYARSNGSGMVAPPGKSYHNYGLAADLEYGPGARDWAHANASKYGLNYPMLNGRPYEPWHIEPAGVRNAGSAAAAAGDSGWRNQMQQFETSAAGFNRAVTDATGSVGQFGSGVGNAAKNVGQAMTGAAGQVNTAGTNLATGAQSAATGLEGFTQGLGNAMSGLAKGIGSIFSGLFPGFATGGYTGPGGKYAPAGVVHRGEYVFDAEATRRIGVRNLEAIRRARGFATGGYVDGVYLPKIPAGGAMASRGGAGSGSATGTPQFHFHNAPEIAETRESTDEQGRPRMDIVFREQTAKSMKSKQVQRAMRPRMTYT